jgi:hypothetical protein
LCGIYLYGIWMVPIAQAGGSGYFRTRAVQPYLASGKLHLVTGAPSFSYPAYAIFSSDADEGPIKQTLGGLRAVAAEETI